LASPIDNTLFFAGEATDTTGHNGTVHGAIASGRRAAKEILHGLD
jgi:monoamine oxidase